MTDERKGLPQNINEILCASGLRHTLHLYTSNVNKYALQAPFLGAAKDEKAIYITNDGAEKVAKELKGLNINLQVLSPNELNKLQPSGKFRIVMDGGSIGTESHGEIEKHLAELSENSIVLCTYNVSKLKPEKIKERVKQHDKLMLTTSDLMLLSSETLDELRPSDEFKERFVKNELETIVLALILNQPMCGTDIIKTIHKEFNVLLSPGTIYPLLHSLKEKGLLKCEYQIKSKTYKPAEKAEGKIKSIVKEHVQASKFLNKFLSSTGLREGVAGKHKEEV